MLGATTRLRELGGLGPASTGKGMPIRLLTPAGSGVPRWCDAGVGAADIPGKPGCAALNMENALFHPRNRVECRTTGEPADADRRLPTGDRRGKVEL